MNNGMGDGDGWVICRRGHRHWGRFGAAGLLIRDRARVILQHRAPWTHEGDAWGIPGGARDSHEDAVTAALREAFEEAALDPHTVRPTGLWVDDHGGWSYTSVVAEPLADLQPYGANAESTDVTWVAADEVQGLTLHRGFAQAWPSLRRRSAGLVVLLGPESAPLGELDPLVQDLARYGVIDQIETGRTETGEATLLPHIILLNDSVPDATRSSGGVRRPWWTRAISEVTTSGSEASAAVLAAATAGKTIRGVVGPGLERWMSAQSHDIQSAIARITPTRLDALRRPAL